MKWVPLGEVTRTVGTWNPARIPSATFSYIDLGAVDQAEKRITATVMLSGADAPSRARQLVAAGDVVVSTVRPNLNAVALVPPELDGATASTGFSVLRSSGDLVDRYLFHWVRSRDFVDEMTRMATGASYPAVSDRIVRDSRIPHFSSREQRRIASILDQADAIRAKRRQVLAHLDTLGQATFHEMFGDPDDAAQTQQLDAVVKLVAGRSLVAADAQTQSTYRVLKISAVTSGIYRPSESKPLPADYEPPEDHIVEAGDLLMSRANTRELVGAVAYVPTTPDRIALPDKIWKFKWLVQDAEPVYFHTLLSTRSIRNRVSQMSSGTGGSMKNVSMASLSKLRIPTTPVESQRAFAVRVASINAHRARVEAALAADDELFASLQSRAFRGEL